MSRIVSNASSRLPPSAVARTMIERVEIAQIGSADGPAMAEREAQMRDARLKVIIKTRHC